MQIQDWFSQQIHLLVDWVAKRAGNKRRERLVREAVANYLVVTAMRSGHCPRCGYLAPPGGLYNSGGIDHSKSMYDESRIPYDGWYECVDCSFSITEDQAREALAVVQPYLYESTELFRSGQL